SQQIVKVLIFEATDLVMLNTSLCQAIRKIPHYASELNTASTKMLSHEKELNEWLEKASQNAKNLLAQYSAFSNVVNKISRFSRKEMDTPSPQHFSTNRMIVDNEVMTNGNAFHIIALLRRNMGVKISYMCSNLMYLRAIVSRLKKLNIATPFLNVLYP